MGIFRAFTQQSQPQPVTPAVPEQRHNGTLFNYDAYQSSMYFENNISTSLTTSEALSVSAFNRGVTLIAEKISNLPLHLYRNGHRVDTPLILEKPYPYETRKDTLNAWVIDYLLNGNAFGLLDGFDEDMYPTIIIPVPSNKVSVIQTNGKLSVRIGDKEYDYSQVMHIKGFHLPGEPVGRGALSMAASTLNHALVQNKHSYLTLKEGSIPPMALMNPIPMEPQEKKALQDAWVARMGDRRIPGILDGGMDIKEFGFSNHENQLLEARKFSVVEIANHLNMDAYWLNSADGGSNTYNNVEEKTLQLISDTLEPIYTRFEHALTAIMRPGEYVKFNPDAFKRVDLLKRYQAHQIALNSRFMTQQEVRDIEDLGPIPPELAKPEPNEPNEPPETPNAA